MILSRAWLALATLRSSRAQWMRIWLNPYKLATYGLMPSDIASAVEAQNVQVTAGELGAMPAVKGQELDATVTAQSQLQTPEQFRNIILKGSTGGALVRLGHVARVELGASELRHDQPVQRPSLIGGLRLSFVLRGPTHLTTADAVQAEARTLAKKSAAGPASDSS